MTDSTPEGSISHKKKPDVSGSAELDDYDYGDGGEDESWEDGEPGGWRGMRYFTGDPLQKYR